MIAAVRRARVTPKSEYAKDRWDMAALGMATADDWARREAMPSDDEIIRLRRLIRRVSENLGSLTPGEQAEIRDAVTAVRKTRQAFLGIPRVRQPLPDVRPERPAWPAAQPPQRG